MHMTIVEIKGLRSNSRLLCCSTKQPKQPRSSIPICLDMPFMPLEISLHLTKMSLSFKSHLFEALAALWLVLDLQKHYSRHTEAIIHLLSFSKLSCHNRLLVCLSKMDCLPPAAPFNPNHNNPQFYWSKALDLDLFYGINHRNAGATTFRASTLNVNIHPLFDYSRVSQTANARKMPTPAEWHFFREARQLATLLITEPALLSWWHPLILSRLPFDVDLEEHAHDYHIDNRTVRLTQSKITALRTHFNQMVPFRRYAFSDSQDVQDAFGKTKLISEATRPGFQVPLWVKGQDTVRARPGVQGRARVLGRDKRAMTEFHLDFLIFARRAMSQRPPLTQDWQVHVQRVQFLFAITLVHELAHAFWLLRIPDGVNRQRGEPRYDRDDDNHDQDELGVSWEEHNIGCQAQDIRWAQLEEHLHARTPHRTFGMFGLFSLSPPIYSPNHQPTNALINPIQASWISDWFDQNTWTGPNGIRTTGRNIMLQRQRFRGLEMPF